VPRSAIFEALKFELMKKSARITGSREKRYPFLFCKIFTEGKEILSRVSSFFFVPPEMVSTLLNQ